MNVRETDRMDIIKVLQQELQIGYKQAEAAVQLIDEGNTIPFIARYRKEATGSLNDEVLRNLDERLRYLRNLEEKKEQVLASIREQEKLTPELEKQILEAMTMVAVDDLYRPYRPKRRTRAMIAKEKGLEPFADMISLQMVKEPLEKLAAAYVSEEKGVASAEEAIAGAKDILAERISDDADYRTYIRKATMEQGMISSSAKDGEAESVYEMYYQYEEPVKRCAGHRVLALNRGEKEKILTVKVTAPEETILRFLEKKTILRDNPYTTQVLKDVVKDSYDRLIAPAIEREVRGTLTETAEAGAIKVFGKNLEQLLMQPPISGRVVLGWDPAFRTGCKLAVVDETGKVLDTAVIYPLPAQGRVREAKEILRRMILKYKVSIVAIGNGTAGRETEAFFVELMHEMDLGSELSYMIVSEAGASVYSASKLAAEEFPQFDVNLRSAVSIARRLQDPLAELVKIDPKSIGVGQYQHDMDQKKLGDALNGVVEDVVNRVGVDLNTASPSLLEYIAGINKTIAKNIVVYREENGAFTNRKQLLKVPKLGPKAFEQCAGFLRVRGGDDPLDETAVHPESYAAAAELMKELGYAPEDIRKGGMKGISRRVTDRQTMAEHLNIGVPTLNDILNELEKPGRDPREDIPKPVLRSDVLDIDDLTPGMILKGTVRNAVDFGVFVDIGVHQDGLVHISEVCRKFIRHPSEIVKVGDVVKVVVLDVDEKKHRISLSMKQVPSDRL